MKRLGKIVLGVLIFSMITVIVISFTEGQDYNFERGMENYKAIMNGQKK